MNISADVSQPLAVETMMMSKGTWAMTADSIATESGVKGVLNGDVSNAGNDAVGPPSTVPVAVCSPSELSTRDAPDVGFRRGDVLRIVSGGETDEGASSGDEICAASPGIPEDHPAPTSEDKPEEPRHLPVVASPRRRWLWSRLRRRKRKDRDVRKNGDGKSVSTTTGAGTPPADRKSKLSTLGKIFRPWKWKRKKKSERIEKTAVELERKISVRTSREELIRKGVIKEPDTTQNYLPKIETLKESDDECLAESSNVSDKTTLPCDDCNSATVDHSQGVQPNSNTEAKPGNGPGSSAPYTVNTNTPTSKAHGALPTADTIPLTSVSSSLHQSVALPGQTVNTPAQSTGPPVPVSCSSVMTRPIIVPAGCPSPMVVHQPHPPPPKYTEAVAQVGSEMVSVGAAKLPPTFQLAQSGIGVKRVAIVAPQEIHHNDDRGHEEEEDDEDEEENEDHMLNKYVIDPDMIHPASPYEAVLASEPDLNKRPHKSALKKAAMSPGPQTALYPAASWTARPLDMSRATPSPTPGSGPAGLPRHIEGPQSQVSPQSTPVGTVRPIPRPRVSIQAIGDNESDKENSLPHESLYPENQPAHDNVGDSDDSSEDDEIRYKDDYDPNSLASKVARNDSLARFLENRPPKDILLAKNIIPEKTDSEKKELRDIVGAKLTRRLSLRPTQEELENRNILHQQSLAEARAEKERKKRYLIRKLSFRPSIEELRDRKIIDFSDYVEVTDAHEYDRKAEKPWTKLTPRDKAAIRKELNEFKSKEMDVHEESRHLTRFHKP